MENIEQEIKLEQAEFLNRLMIDAELTENDIKIGLCLLHELLKRLQQKNTKRD